MKITVTGRVAVAHINQRHLGIVNSFYPEPHKIAGINCAEADCVMIPGKPDVLMVGRPPHMDGILLVDPQ
jgi:hypothetical protein